jgi:hypothetical protein
MDLEGNNPNKEEYFELEPPEKNEVRVILNGGCLDCIKTGDDVPDNLTFTLVDFDVEGIDCDEEAKRFDTETERVCVFEETHADDN